MSIKKNFDELLVTLTKIKECTDCTFKAEDAALATGIVNKMMDKKFIFVLQFLCELLNAMEPANRILQSRDIGFRQAMPVIEAANENVKLLRNKESYQKFLQTTGKIMSTNELIPQPQPVRIRRRSTRLSDSILMSTLGERQLGDEVLRSIYFEVIDRVLCEISIRFTQNNETLKAISAASEILHDDFDRNALLPLNAIGLTVPSQAELTVFKTFLANEKKKPEWQNCNNMLKILFPVKSAFTETYRFLEGVDTFGSSTSVNESAFSAVSRIDTAQRMSMTDQRLRDLAYIAFEKKSIPSLKEEDIIREFVEKTRRIQLY